MPPTVKAFRGLVASRQAAIRQTMETKYPDAPGQRAGPKGSSKPSRRNSRSAAK